MRKYYQINEETARLAKMQNSFSDYRPGEATEIYKGYCDKAYDLLDQIRKQKPREAEKAEGKVDYYCRKLADYFNAYYRNEASCPSVMICGPANFPTRKKERQNSRRDTLMKEWKRLEEYLQKIKNILYGPQVIRSGDPDALETLKEKLESLINEKESMKRINAYYRKNGTLKGYPEPFTKEQQRHIDFVFSHGMEKFGIFDTSNINQQIRSVKQRIERLEKEKSQGNVETESNGSFKVIENIDIMRLQIIFDGKPPEEARDLLKSHGFRWSPKNGAWQRQLTNNARYAYKQIREDLEKSLT